MLDESERARATTVLEKSLFAQQGKHKSNQS